MMKSIRHSARSLIKVLPTLILIFLFSFSINSLLSQEISTKAEIYDYEIGDIFHYHVKGGGKGNVEHTLSVVKIINKYYSQDSAKLYYVRNIIFEYYNNWGGDDDFGEYDDIISYDNLDSPINNGDIDTVYSDNSEYNGRKINEKVIFGIGNIDYIWTYVNGCGRARYSFFNTETSGFVNNSLVYYKKGIEEWGEPLMLVKINNISAKENEVVLYPNPAKNDFRIKSDKPIKTCTFYSLQGQFIQTINIEKKDPLISVSNLVPGMYLLILEAEDEIIRKRIIVE